ncbi:alpha/beta-hydrolase family protein [Terrabacter sp. MAHUQ-38]|uniref:alpha/beta hydrolase n=1 Tax=unclassified Terrabacter TaxID=2630222 RepID=UPI00165D4F1B|nr:alpha/beta-hydrolase family protein [Terrabacter sp. MAHUQ-38]MBC9820905.1 alpha/beta-hydrolase family protein [Terrabacter sp. MAHUQ-38]
MPDAPAPRTPRDAGRPWWHLSRTGLFFGAAYFLTSMAPSLLPRTWYYQGLISGLCAAAGYGLGVVIAWVVRSVARLIDLRVTVSGEARHWLLVAAPVFGAVAVLGLTVANVRAQARTAAFVRLTPLDPLDWAMALAVATLIAVLFLAVARGLRSATYQLAEAAGHVLPKTIATLIAVVVVALATAWITDSVLFHRGMQAFAGVAAQVNTTPSGRAAPTSPLRSGGPGSLESYGSLGFQGQMFVTSAPTPAEITAATGRGAIEPIRVYAGRTSDRSVADVADAVVAELQRTKAFNRRVLAVFTTTGTGWVDDWSAQSIEYLANGDSAIAAMQYSYLPSAMSMMTDRDTPREAGKALFDKVYAVWRAMPEDDRPQLVVGGESLGSYGGHAAFADADDMIARAGGGVWVGTPSFTDIAATLTAQRNEGSPEIVPVVDDGIHIRFAASGDELAHDYYGRDYSTWEFPRFVYAQHPSDPVVWWNPALLGAEPDWLREPRGRDVNPDVTWIPFVTFWQLTTDMAVGHDPPDGYGHRYGPELVPAWGSVLGGSPTDDYSRIVAGIEGTVSRVE